MYSLSIFLNGHHRGHGAIRLSDDVKRPAFKIVAAENPLVAFESLFIGPLVALAKIPPVAAVVTVEDLKQRILPQTFRSRGSVDLPEGKARFHEAVWHGEGGSENGGFQVSPSGDLRPYGDGSDESTV